MGINIRQKGADAERHVATTLNTIIQEELAAIGREVTRPVVQRNQNQSAVGGGDLSNVFGLSIEVKRQEALSIEAWWKQCVDAAKRNNEIPILLFKQSHKAWRCITEGWVGFSEDSWAQYRLEISWEHFLDAFRSHVRSRLIAGDEVRT